MGKEKEPNRERGPLYDDCSNCGNVYNLTEHNTIFFEHKEFPNADHFLVISDCCEYLTRIFVSEDSTSRKYITRLNIPRIVSRVPDDETMESYIYLYEIPLVEPTELTTRQNTKVDFLGYLLEHDMISPEDFDKDVEI